MEEAHSKPLVGAHTSAAGGAFNALLHGQRIGAATIQFFTSNQKTWKGKIYTDKEVELWNKTREETGIDTVMVHGSYLINLGSPVKETLDKGRKAFREEIERCHLLEIDFLNFHPGAFTSGTVEACLDTIIESLIEVAPLTKKGKTRLLYETTAGQGTCVGWTFEELGYLIKHTHKILPIGVCIDTCHIYSAGYDIRTQKGWDATLKEFDRHIGIEYLYALHLNDSKKPLSSRRDRHAPLGKGEIGIDCFKVIMNHPKLKNLPMYLETPETDRWPEEIQLLKSFCKRGPNE